MSEEQESLIFRIRKNYRKIELFGNTHSDGNGQIIINHLRKENIKLEEMLRNLRQLTP